MRWCPALLKSSVVGPLLLGTKVVSDNGDNCGRTFGVSRLISLSLKY